MLRRPGRSSLLRRIDDLEGRFTDESCMAPNSPEWLAFWDRQLYNSLIGEKFALLPVESFRAVWRYSEDPKSLVGKYWAQHEDEDEL